ncbi:MAG TPA: hypothetical protein VGD26_11965 [Chitinophagaceae bacterium]
MKKLPFIYRMIRGAIGKRFVIKHYKYGIVKTRYPDMSRIVPSEAQRMRRRLFKRAVVYAQKVYANPALKEEKRRMLRRPKRLFQALMKDWFRQQKEKLFLNERRINRWRNNLSQSKTVYTNNITVRSFLISENSKTYLHEIMVYNE